MSNPQHEPTMEEILASIRKIISEDASEPEPVPAAPQAAAPQPVTAQPVVQPAPVAELKPEPVVHAAAEDDDVLELTEEVAPEPVHAAAPQPVAPAPHDDIVFQAVEEEPQMSAPQTAYQPEPAHDEAPARDHGIFTDRSRKALDDVFASITPEEEEDHMDSHPAPVPGLDGDSVATVFERAVRDSFDPVLKSWLSGNKDDVVERMKPVIREWMDQHFPSMLEEAVRNEVARVAKARPPRR